MTEEQMTERPRYVILNDTERPEPRSVCQWVPGKGYCYLYRGQSRPDFDGMQGREATPVEAFGWCWAEDEDGGSWVRFYRTEQEPTAAYRDGEPRRWQHPGTYFEFKRLKMKVTA